MTRTKCSASSLPGFHNSWVFYARTTNVEFDIYVDDTFDFEPPKVYLNPLGTSLHTPVTDTNAFSTCLEPPPHR